jgi:GTP cyclohydrolase II
MKTVRSTNLETNSATLPHATVRQKVDVPLDVGTGTFVTFHNLLDKKEHVAIVFESKAPQIVPLVRVHSECLTGDVFASGRCDCGEQLNESLRLLHEQGGVLLYLRQEGRGIGLYNKLDAYSLQKRGFDTYEANNLLGFNDDLRGYDVAAQMLLALGLKKIRLLSNNPDKAKQLQDAGICVAELKSTGAFVKDTNKNYLLAKVRKTGHQILLGAEQQDVLHE